MNDFLLDTCAMLWLAEGTELSGVVRKTVADGKINVSPITIWEIANLVRKKRIALSMPVVKWFRRAVEMMEAGVPELTIDILAGSCELPGSPPSDPADRIIIATAREGSMIVMTRDKDILAYSREGHVRAMVC